MNLQSLTALPSSIATSKMNRLPPVSTLMSPPEAKSLDSFSSTISPFDRSQTSTFHNDIKLPPIYAEREQKRTQSEMDLPSPPVTPYTGNKKQEPVERDLSVGSSRDPVLFPRHDASNEIATDVPLFGPILDPRTEALVDEHITSHMALFENKVNKPTRDEYLLALSCVPIVSTQYNRNPSAWAKQERETLERQLALMSRYRPRSNPLKLKRIAPAPAKKSLTSQPRLARAARPKRVQKGTPPQRVLDSFGAHLSSTPRQPRVLGTNRDDTDFQSLPDYSPSVDRLSNNLKGLKADWKGQMLDLSHDPDRHLLDPAEISLASTLRLSCATYLCSKRRIFEGRVRALNIGKEFRKTDAQQACKIDVNKASKLWTAYDRVGWFKPEHFEKYST